MSDRVSPSRRSVVRGAAWSVPVVAVAATAPAFAASPCTNRTALLPVSWSSSYSTTQQTGSIAGSPVVNVTAGYTSTLLGGGALNAQNLTPTSVAATRDSISLVNNSPTTLSLNAEGNFQTVTFTFARDVYGLTFSIDDIDRVAGSYHDHVFLSGAPETPTVTLGSAVTGAGTSGSPWRTTASSGDNATSQTVTVTYPNGMVPMTSLTLRFYSTLAPVASAQHVVRIRQMRLRTCA